MAKSMKTAFIRVTSKNDTQNGIVSYVKSDIDTILREWSASCKLTYWFIEHSADDEVSMTHWHVLLRFSSPTPFENIKSKFPYGDIENARSIKACVQYLVHMNDKSKVQYKWEDIATNCEDMTPFKVQSNAQGEVTIQRIMEQIDSGNIREYNQFEAIPIEIWAKYKSRIENGLTYYRERVCMEKNREINVVFMSGDTGTGKTTFAKQWCDTTKKSYCISSTSNDPMQDYKGEDVLILDDLRDSDYSFTDLLKILDNHTKSTIKSRYHNKAFIGDTIIITSYRPLADWYFNVERESKEQLYRRIKTQYKFYEDKIQCFEYSQEKHKYEYICKTPNIVLMKAREKVNVGINMLKAMGLEFDTDLENDIHNKIDEMTDEQLDMEFSKVDDAAELPFD